MNNLKTWQCITCGFIYSEKAGIPEEGISAGTRWQDIPEDWLCPDCGMGKDDFQMEDVTNSGLNF